MYNKTKRIINPAITQEMISPALAIPAPFWLGSAFSCRLAIVLNTKPSGHTIKLVISPRIAKVLYLSCDTVPVVVESILFFLLVILVEQFFLMLRRVILQVSGDSVVSRSRNYFLICHLENTNCVLNFLFLLTILPLMDRVVVFLRFIRDFNRTFR
jgi:hypothetical protein